jgi:hypothetical protein
MAMLTSDQISGLAIELLSRKLVLAATVTRIPGGEFAGPSGGTVNLRVPAKRTANVQSVPGADITATNINESSVAVTVDHVYDAVTLTDEELSLELVDFGRQVLMPQVDAVARKAEDELAAAINGVTLDATIEFPLAADADADKAVVLAIREKLTTNETGDERYLAVAPNIATRLLNVPQFVEAAARGNGTALETAVLGTIYGMTVVESAALTTGTAVGYVKSAFALGTLAPTQPGGGADSSVAENNGVSMRHVLAFDAGKLASLSVVSTFVGAAVIDEADNSVKRAVRVDTAAA